MMLTSFSLDLLAFLLDTLLDTLLCELSLVCDDCCLLQPVNAIALIADITIKNFLISIFSTPQLKILTHLIISLVTSEMFLAPPNDSMIFNGRQARDSTYFNGWRNRACLPYFLLKFVQRKLLLCFLPVAVMHDQPALLSINVILAIVQYIIA
ncbi:hypothetical protein [Lactobacillus delbrueckii]|uniref:hypothetical protein n=1 Tax=Lactobacillus delbrueckii TaxID=1584 RepID=UPI001EE88925|nr:hypothetical protein [Lactobacillus delbrueckii]